MAKDIPFLHALISGGVAGTSVDVTLFPLDTIKTRLQSSAGFKASGGFKGIFKGLSAAAAGSAPGAALFFSTYETMKPVIHQTVHGTSATSGSGPISHMLSASCGEVAACLVRVPTEVVKQRMQVGMHSSIQACLRDIFSTEGPLGIYRGYSTTVCREIPFSFIQFPIWERLKQIVRNRNDGQCSPLQGATCGALAGGFSAAVTTPLDVAKTRIMLTGAKEAAVYSGTISTLLKIQSEEGVRRLFSGVLPRTFWITIGGFVFFGAYETSVKVLGRLN